MTVAGPLEAMQREWRETFICRSTYRRPIKMRTAFRKSRTMLLMGLSPLLLACEESTSPPDSAVGSYTAVSFITTPTGGNPRNEIQAGSTLTLNLVGDGSTSGHLHVAAANVGSPPFDADMAGTWVQNGLTVDISQGADTFVRDMPFTMTAGPIANWDLVGDAVFDGVRIQVTLRRI